jgi:hypothetical protein
VNKLNQALLIFLGLAILVLLFWSPALMPGRALYLRDISIEIIPYRSFWARSHGFALWNPYAFFGMPFAANPQLGAFYPLNFLFLINPIEKGLVVYVIVHYLLAAFFTYLLFCEMDFSKETSALASVAFVFSGMFSSLSNLIVLLSVASWLPVAGWLALRSLKRRWLLNILGLAIIFSVQNFAGDPQVLASCILLCAALGLGQIWKSKPEKNVHLRLFGGLAIALVLALVITSPQNFLTLEMLPRSNRAAGYSFEQFTLWSLSPQNLLTLFFPNNFLPPENILWLAGFLLLPSFLLSIYPGISVLLLGAFSLRGNRKIAALWLVMFGMGIFLALGKSNPFYRIFYELPLLKLIRIPEKLFLISAFSLVVLAALGLEAIANKPLKVRSWFYSIPFFAVGLLLIVTSFIVRGEALSAEVPLTAKHLLILSSIFKSAAALLVLAGWILAAAHIKKPFVFPLGLALIVFVDLGGAHFRLNPTTDSSFYHSVPKAVSDLDQLRPQGKEPLRIASVHPKRDELFGSARNVNQFYVMLRDWIDPFWGIYFQVDDVLAKGSFYLSDIDLFHDILNTSLSPDKIYGQCAVRQIYQADRGLVQPPGALDRAMVFYQAENVPDREQAIKLWSSPQFHAEEKILLEGASAQAGYPASPAQIVNYSNQEVMVKFNARTVGWLALFDTFYPGWRAYLDGKEQRIYRADVFFRAVAVPAGEHTVEFRYLPGSFVYGIIIGGAGLAAWFALVIFAQIKWKQRSPTGSGSPFSWF